MQIGIDSATGPDRTTVILPPQMVPTAKEHPYQCGLHPSFDIFSMDRIGGELVPVAIDWARHREAPV